MKECGRWWHWHQFQWSASRRRTDSQWTKGNAPCKLRGLLSTKQHSEVQVSLTKHYYLLLVTVAIRSKKRMVNGKQLTIQCNNVEHISNLDNCCLLWSTIFIPQSVAVALNTIPTVSYQFNVNALDETRSLLSIDVHVQNSCTRTFDALPLTYASIHLSHGSCTPCHTRCVSPVPSFRLKGLPNEIFAIQTRGSTGNEKRPGGQRERPTASSNRKSFYLH